MTQQIRGKWNICLVHSSIGKSHEIEALAGNGSTTRNPRSLDLRALSSHVFTFRMYKRKKIQVVQVTCCKELKGIWILCELRTYKWNEGVIIALEIAI